MSSRSPPTMGLQKVKLGSSDLEVTEVCLGTMTWGIQNTEDEAYVSLGGEECYLCLLCNCRGHMNGVFWLSSAVSR